jgi:hypothetical protein
MRKLLNPFAVALAALVVLLRGSAIAAGAITGSDEPETVLRMRVTRDGKPIATHNDHGQEGRRRHPRHHLQHRCERFQVAVEPRRVRDRRHAARRARVDTGGGRRGLDVQRLAGFRIFVESTRPVPRGDNQITPFPTSVTFDGMAVC